MPDWRCARCGVVNLVGQRVCELCGREPQPTPPRRAPAAGMPAYRTPPWMLEPPPCSEEENFRALHLVRAVTEHLITIHHAHLGLHALFHGRELDDGISTCACGIELAPRK